jgi:hypothetical protein
MQQRAEPGHSVQQALQSAHHLGRKRVAFYIKFYSQKKILYIKNPFFKKSVWIWSCNDAVFATVLTEWRWLWTLPLVCREFAAYVRAAEPRLMRVMCSMDGQQTISRALARDLLALDDMLRKPIERRLALALAMGRHGEAFVDVARRNKLQRRERQKRLLSDLLSA